LVAGATFIPQSVRAIRHQSGHELGFNWNLTFIVLTLLLNSTIVKTLIVFVLSLRGNELATGFINFCSVDSVFLRLQHVFNKEN
jgi:hypothetical protein